VDPLQLSAVVQPAVDIKYFLFMLILTIEVDPFLHANINGVKPEASAEFTSVGSDPTI
jgi:hypothetical protein